MEQNTAEALPKEAKPRRGRPPREGVSRNAEMREHLSNQREDRKKKSKVIDEYYEETLTDYRLVQVTENGNKYRQWLCTKNPKIEQHKNLIKTIRESGKLRIAS